MTAYYNEHDPFAAAWLRELIKDGLIAPGEVDERSIEDVTPDDIRSFRQCHFFAGIGVWSLAARRSGIPDDALLWSGSCPCQPFSAAGKGGGFDDERHLWPAFFHLIEQCRPEIVVGEQVAGRDGDTWLDLVQSDVEATGYAFGAVETVACGFGAPHKRSRNYWMAHAAHGDGRRGERGAEARAWPNSIGGRRSASGGPVGLVADREREGLERQPRHFGDSDKSRRFRAHAAGSVAESCDSCGVADAKCCRRQQQSSDGPTSVQLKTASERGRLLQSGDNRPSLFSNGRPGPVNGVWRDADWLRCCDEKWRPVEPGTFPLVDAGTFRNRVGLLRGAGNAITIGQAEGFLRAVQQSLIANRPAPAWTPGGAMVTGADAGTGAE